jgi:poly(3-hydroxybutyrate) depolymerase
MSDTVGQARRGLLVESLVLVLAVAGVAVGQAPPYDVFPPAEPPYYRVRYEASTEPDGLIYPVNYTLWIPPGVKQLRGVIVHQHGCGEGSCKSGLTGAYDLHWQALARKHACGLLAPAYEQPEKADCQKWCDPRNGSAAAFQRCLADLGAVSGHPELPRVPWAVWGHSGGGHWAGGMALLHPDRVAAAWLRSGVPLFEPDPKREGIKPHVLPDAALRVPVMCNPGTQEGVTVKDGRFAGVWPANEAFFQAVRGRGGLVGVAVDPLTAHECGNQRYLAIPWLDACLAARLPQEVGQPLRPMPAGQAWLAAITGTEARPVADHQGDPLQAGWLPNEAVARRWMEYVKDTKVADTSPPPAPKNLRVRAKGAELSWDAEADPESGLAGFVVERDGEVVANLPEQPKNPFGRPVFQGLQYSDTPALPLVPLEFRDMQADPGRPHRYRVLAVNTAGLKSLPSEEVVAEVEPAAAGGGGR